MKRALLGLCSVIDEHFSQGMIDPLIWEHQVTMSGGGKWEFEWYTNNRSNSYIKNNSLHIKPSLTYDNIKDQMLFGTLDLFSAGCTDNGYEGCRRSANGKQIINPIQSAKLISKKSIKRGKVEVLAKLPVGDWIWPAIWLLPKYKVYGEWPASGEIDIMESRGNKPGCTEGSVIDGHPSCHPGRDSIGSTLHFGPDWRWNRWDLAHGFYQHNHSLSDDFHTYGMIWTENQITIYVDFEENVVLKRDLNDLFKFGEFPDYYNNPWMNRPQAPFDQEFYLVINVAVGGTDGFFFDGVDGKPWKDGSATSALDFWNARDKWLPTWPDDDSRALVVKSVQMWQEC